MDHLLELYEEDRRSIRRTGNDLNGGAESGTSGEVPHRTRPALTDKQYSEPNSPVSRNFEQPTPTLANPMPYKRPMNRGYSDLGTRFMRKKVIVK